MLRLIYALLFYLSIPFLKCKDFFDKKKFPNNRFQERYAITHITRPAGKLIWFHGASVGECISLIPVITAIHKQWSQITILVTSGTHAAAKFVPQHLPNKAIHQYIPYDHAPYVERFLKHWQPDFVVWVEADYWPNLIIKTAQKNIPLILLNGRLSTKAFNRWRYYPPLIKTVVHQFKIIFAQTNEDLKRFEQLGNLNVRIATNLKYFIQVPPLKKEEDPIKKHLEKRKIILAASTHPGEESCFFNIFKNLQQKHPSLLMIIAPRHAHRRAEIIKLLKQQKLNYAVRSQKQEIKSSTQIYLADTFGELHYFFHLSPIVFIGGSLVPIGGHTPVEPAHHHCALLSGPYTFKNEKTFDEFYQSKACIKVTTEKELENKLGELLEKKPLQQTLARNAYALVTSKQKTEKHYMNEVIKCIQPYVKNNT